MVRVWQAWLVQPWRFMARQAYPGISWLGSSPHVVASTASQDSPGRVPARQEWLGKTAPGSFRYGRHVIAGFVMSRPDVARQASLG